MSFIFRLSFSSSAARGYKRWTAKEYKRVREKKLSLSRFIFSLIHFAVNFLPPSSRSFLSYAFQMKIHDIELLDSELLFGSPLTINFDTKQKLSKSRAEKKPETLSAKSDTAKPLRAIFQVEKIFSRYNGKKLSELNLMHALVEISLKHKIDCKIVRNGYWVRRMFNFNFFFPLFELRSLSQFSIFRVFLFHSSIVWRFCSTCFRH